MATPPSPIYYPASRLAAAAGLNKRTVSKALEAIPPAGTVIVSGNAADAWSFASLPARWQRLIEDNAARRGFRNALALLDAPPRAWQPSIPLNELRADFLNDAALLQKALLPVFKRLNDISLSEAEFATFGVRCYREATGKTISARHWQRLFERTIERDGGAENWDRLEIYLADRLARKASGAAPADATHAEHPLNAVLTTFANAAAPTRDEQSLLWVKTLEHFETMLAQGITARRAKSELLNVLFARAPFLAATREGLRKQFETRFPRWEADRRPAAVADQRAEKSGRHRAPELSQADRDTIVGHAVLHTGGRLAQAWRELVRENGLSEELLGHYLSNPANKSHVPRRVRDAVKFDVARLDDIHHGPRQAKLNGAFISRDWSGVSAGDWYQADDCTLPIYYHETDGNGWHTLWRGQFLLFIDLRTTCILGYVLLSSRVYNAFAIRTLITKTCDEHGLPRQGFYFERNIWERSKIITGGKAARAALSNAETESGLRDLGLRFIHANLPRAKPVEFVLGHLQNYMEGVPGYAGRDERHDRFERVQKLKLEVESRKLNPEGHFLNAEQWLALLDDICARYNAEPKQGKMTEGLSPEDAFAKFQDPGDPQIRLDASCRYLLAHHRRPVRVTRNGIVLRFGKNVFVYRNAATGALVGENVLAWFNPETPEILTVTDAKRRNAFCVERAEDVPAVDAPREVLGRELERIAAHQAPAKAYYKILRAKFAPAFRLNLPDQRTARLGAEFDTQQRAATQERRERTVRTDRFRAKAETLGVPAALRGDATPEAIEALQRLEQTPRETAPATGGNES